MINISVEHLRKLACPISIYLRPINPHSITVGHFSGGGEYAVKLYGERLQRHLQYLYHGRPLGSTIHLLSFCMRKIPYVEDVEIRIRLCQCFGNPYGLGRWFALKEIVEEDRLPNDVTILLDRSKMAPSTDEYSSWSDLLTKMKDAWFGVVKRRAYMSMGYADEFEDTSRIMSDSSMETK